ncbi:hypothetical protein GCM10018793_59520 [Streptomyces sulfonofaciens]|uniref:DUF3515 domain-containing protein n=1 Tax=Streptomyces sulfonofaciens TaxID=68272 RepID=A0A919GLD1_9ACTN|nr:DUF3515 domain-containing protein [Streptomyces sulfonofaciens]GHH86657.1 hypothetical protein GCM10018793_59520 [Streptomyces sulfonofaciens]
MRFFRHRHGNAVRPPVLVLLLTASAAAGCTSTDEAATVAVPTPAASTASYCDRLHRQLPRHLDGLGRNDPKPRSALTAGWGDPAIILRCGVPRPAAMDAAPGAGDAPDDDGPDGVEVNGVGWLSQPQDDGSYRFTTTLRKAYVEVILPKQRTGEGLAPLTDLAGPVKRSIPQGIAD